VHTSPCACRGSRSRAGFPEAAETLGQNEEGGLQNHSNALLKTAFAQTLLRGPIGPNTILLSQTGIAHLPASHSIAQCCRNTVKLLQKRVIRSQECSGRSPPECTEGAVSSIQHRGTLTDAGLDAAIQKPGYSKDTRVETPGPGAPGCFVSAGEAPRKRFGSGTETLLIALSMQVLNLIKCGRNALRFETTRRAK